jgi:hypothetical protein
MTNYWAIAIGINQYRQFQPLMYAQRDALALRNYWVNEAGFASERCLLFTDTSPAFEETAVYPTRESIQTYITRLCQEQLQSGDFLWCFFSGYGVQFEGKDYLMPIEGDPAQIPTTGIAVEALFNTLRTAPTDRILLVLDMNRSLGVQAGDRVGAQTATLAEAYQIPTILSCAPDQFSHETLALRHGLFTAALLEGMRYHGCSTLNQLVHYVSDRVLELSDHHWRPQQHPVAVIPPHMQYQFVLPQPEIAAVGATPGAGGTVGLLNSPQSGTGIPHANGFVPASASETNGAGINGSKPYGYSGETNGSASHHSLTPIAKLPGYELKPDPSPDLSAAPPAESIAQSEISDAVFWRRLLLWGGAIALALLLLVLLRNQSVLFRPASPQPSPSTVSPLPTNPTANPENSLNPAGNSSDGNSDIATNGSNNSGNPPSDESATAFFNLDDSEQPDTEQPGTTGTSGTGNNSNPNGLQTAGNGSNSGNAADTGTSQTNLEQSGNQQSGNPSAATAATSSAFNEARNALQARQYEQALTLLDRVPANQRDAGYEQLRRQANQGLLSEARALLNETRNSSRVSQASDFSRAIAKAQRIRPEDPLYAQAQQDIERWNQVIWDIAQGRASRGNYDSAIAAARLIPARQTALYPTVQASISQWQQAKANQAVIQQAQNLIRRSQASSYNRAIATVRNIRPDQPLYDDAQLLKNEWSTAILTIARSRAAQGQYRDAIQTAVLVPRDTQAYQSAQAAIAQWRNR